MPNDATHTEHKLCQLTDQCHLSQTRTDMLWPTFMNRRRQALVTRKGDAGYVEQAGSIRGFSCLLRRFSVLDAEAVSLFTDSSSCLPMPGTRSANFFLDTSRKLFFGRRHHHHLLFRCSSTYFTRPIGQDRSHSPK